MTERTPLVSVVVPVFDEAETIEEVTHRLLHTLRGRYDPFEVLLIDDRSSDTSWELIGKLAAVEDEVRGVRLARNSGQTAALCAGLTVARGEIIATIDCDLDTYPEDLPLLVAEVQAGADLAGGIRQGRAAARRLSSAVFSRRMRALGLPYRDAGCGMLAMTQAVAREMLEHGELRRNFQFKPLVASLSDRVVEVPVRARPTRPSHHRLGDLVSSSLEVGVVYRRTAFLAPFAVGAVTAVAAVLSLVALAVDAATGGRVTGWAPLFAALIGLVGLLLATVGMGLNMALRALDHQGRPFFRIADTTDAPPPPTGRYG